MNPHTDQRLPVILLTGFLGAGKSTLLLRWLSESPATGRRMGVVMNEFGQESVDSQLINRPGLPLTQVSGGCICCADDNEIARAVKRLVDSGKVDYLVVETSGLADPDNVIDVLTDPDLLPEIRLQGVVTVVDAQWFAQPMDPAGERMLARKQVEFAQVVGLSRCDLIEEQARVEVERGIASMNPRARCIRLPFGLPELGALLDGPPAEFEISLGQQADSGEATHLHSTYQSVTWRFPVPVDRSRFEEFLSRLDPRLVVRAKGFVRFARNAERLHLFQSVWGHHVIDEWKAEPAPQPVAVLIGPKLDAEAITRDLRAMVFGAGAGRIQLR